MAKKSIKQEYYLSLEEATILEEMAEAHGITTVTLLRTLILQERISGRYSRGLASVSQSSSPTGDDSPDLQPDSERESERKPVPDKWQPL